MRDLLILLARPKIILLLLNQLTMQIELTFSVTVKMISKGRKNNKISVKIIICKINVKEIVLLMYVQSYPDSGEFYCPH